MMLLSGEPNAAVHELWATKALRSFQKKDGHKRLADLKCQFVAETHLGEVRHRIFPDRDPRVVRVLKKAVRGLAYHHDLFTGLPDDRVDVEVMKYVVPPEFLDQMQHHHRERDIFEYWYSVFAPGEDADFHSAWLLQIYERRLFIAWITKSEASMSDVDSR